MQKITIIFLAFLSLINLKGKNIIFLIGVHVCQSHIISKQGLAGNL